MAYIKHIMIIIGSVFLYYIYRVRYNSIRVTHELDKEYDYIIVGGGSAGSVLAARLSEDEAVGVLLLEAGPAEYPNTAMPINQMNLINSEINWNIRTEPQEHCCKSIIDRVGVWPRGKILGGSSVLNANAYIRGSRHDYDAWEDQGCEGWGYDDVLPYFIKSEGNQDEELVKSGYHGSEGPLKVSIVKSTPLVGSFLEAGKELGYKVLDVNGQSQYGFSTMQATSYRGAKCSSADAYLRPNSRRPNLHIVTESHVTKILFKDNKAVGVQFQRNGKQNSVNSRREVIVSAGTVHSPQILMLSGIGPKTELQKFGIPVIADLPVGQNLQDHTFVPTVFSCEANITLSEDKVSLKTIIEYLLFGTGWLSSSSLEGSAFFRSSLQPESHKYPYLQLHLATGHPGTNPSSKEIGRKHFNTLPEAFASLYEGTGSTEGFLLMNILLHPYSRGNITIRNTDPFQPPVVTTNYLQDPRDLDFLTEIIQIQTKLEKTQAFKKIGARLPRKKNIFCKDYEWGSTDYWRCYARENVVTVYHPTSTCKMGGDNDQSAVVDPQLRVKGIKGLRVVDASVMPFVVSGNTNAPVIMIAEKASDLIKKDWKNKKYK